MRTIKLLATLRDIAGQKEIQVPFEAGSVRDLLTTINQVQPVLGEAIWDSQGQLTGRVHILINGRNIDWLNQLDSAIEADDQLIFLPPSAGG